MIEIILSVINFIAIVVLYIIVLTRNSKEKFTGAPSGYTNLLVSDPDGNLDTFSLSTLENDIDAKITALQTSLETRIGNALSKAEASAASLYQPKGDYLTNGVRVALRSAVASGCGNGYSKYLTNGCGKQFVVKTQGKNQAISVGLMDPNPPQGEHVDDHTWLLQKY